MTYQDQCLPCLLDYQYIMKIEHWFPETEYVFKEIHHKKLDESKTAFRRKHFDGNELRELLKAHTTTSDEKWMQQALQLPGALLNDVIKEYEVDFDLFGYLKPWRPTPSPSNVDNQ